MRMGLRARIRRLRLRHGRSSSPPRREETPVLRGKLRCSVVISDPGEPFAEAVFVLRESALRSPGLSRAELLEQARESAGLYTRALLPARKSLRPLAVFLLGTAAGLLLTVLLGLL